MPDFTTESPAAREGSEKLKGEIVERGVKTEKQIDRLAREKEIEHRELIVKAVVENWKSQQEQDRKTRKSYANILIVILGLQVLAINVAFFLMGFGLMKIAEGTAKTFIITTFAEISGLVWIVTKYLFPPISDRILDIIDRMSPGAGGRSSPSPRQTSKSSPRRRAGAGRAE